MKINKIKWFCVCRRIFRQTRRNLFPKTYPVSPFMGKTPEFKLWWVSRKFYPNSKEPPDPNCRLGPRVFFTKGSNLWLEPGGSEISEKNPQKKIKTLKRFWSFRRCQRQFSIDAGCFGPKSPIRKDRKRSFRRFLQVYNELEKARAPGEKIPPRLSPILHAGPKKLEDPTCGVRAIFWDRGELATNACFLQGASIFD